MNQDDEIDPYLDDNLSGDGILDFGDEQSSSIKRKLHTTVAGATVGKKQVRPADKRQHQQTNRLGVNVAMKDRHVIYATEIARLKTTVDFSWFPEHIPRVSSTLPLQHFQCFRGMCCWD